MCRRSAQVVTKKAWRYFRKNSEDWTAPRNRARTHTCERSSSSAFCTRVIRARLAKCKYCGRSRSSRRLGRLLVAPSRPSTLLPMPLSLVPLYVEGCRTSTHTYECAVYVSVHMQECVRCTVWEIPLLASNSWTMFWEELLSDSCVVTHTFSPSFFS